jgi:hypothetical protein
MEEITGLPALECPVCSERIPVMMTGEEDVTITLHDGVPDAAQVELTVRIEHTCRAKATMGVHAGPDGPVRGISVSVPGETIDAPSSARGPDA